MPPQKAKVLYIDGSQMIRDFLCDAFRRDGGVAVVGVCPGIREGIDRAAQSAPDVILADMDTITVPRALSAPFRQPVVAFSVTVETEPLAQRLGARGYIVLPEDPSDAEFAQFIRRMAGELNQAVLGRTSVPAIRRRGVVALGASTGGTQATSEIFRGLPSDLPGIVMVQHMPPTFTSMYAESLSRVGRIRVKEAVDGDLVTPGQALIAPGERHMELVRQGSGYSVRVFSGEKISGHRPSVDVLFRSVARVAGRDSVGVILTGMGADGADGLLEMRRSGAYTLGQDEASSVVYGMPKEAYLRGAVVRQVSKEQMAAALVNFLRIGR